VKEIGEGVAVVTPEQGTVHATEVLVEEVAMGEEKTGAVIDVVAQGGGVEEGKSVPQNVEVETIVVQVPEEVVEKISVESPKVTMNPLEPRMVILSLEPNSLKLTRAARNNFSSFVKKLKNYPKATILVKGFVSSKSDSPENVKLLEARVLSVYKMLLKNGIKVEQIEMEGMGNQEPIAFNDTKAGRAKNRRVEITVISDGL